MRIPAGTEFKGPYGQGYRLKSDVVTGDPITIDTFEPFGGAPQPRPNEQMPDWLARGIKVENARLKSLPD